MKSQLGVTMIELVIVLIITMIIATVVAMIQYANIKVLKQVARFYIWVIRGTPLLVQLFIIFFGLPKLGIIIDPFPCAIIAFSINEGAYCAETMRAALDAVPSSQMEAGYCAGLSYFQIMRRIVLPQAFRTGSSIVWGLMLIRSAPWLRMVRSFSAFKVSGLPPSTVNSRHRLKSKDA